MRSIDKYLKWKQFVLLFTVSKCENRTVWLSVKSLFVFVVVFLKNSVNFENIVVLCCMDYATIGHVHKPICFCNAEMFVKNSIENQLANPLVARVMNTEKATISKKKQWKSNYENKSTNWPIFNVIQCTF